MSSTALMYETVEFESLDIAVGSLMDYHGNLMIRHGLDKYFLLSVSRGQLQLKAQGWIGLVPLSEEVWVKIIPRVRIGNLEHMLVTAGLVPDFVKGSYRQLSGHRDTWQLFRDLIVRGFSRAAAGVLREGIPRSVERELGGSANPRGRLDFAKTRSLWAKGQVHKAGHRYPVVNTDTVPNRFIKSGAKVALYYLSSEDKGAQTEEINCVRYLLHSLHGVRDETTREWATVNDAAIRKIGEVRPAYAAVIQLSKLLLTATGPDVARELRRGILDSFVFDMALVFENYIREALKKEPTFYRGGLRLCDGNDTHLGDLFREGNSNALKPDYAITSGGTVWFVGDAKYKPKAKEADRYQVISHAVALGATRAALILPAVRKGGVHFLGTVGPNPAVELYEIRVNLGAEDIGAEEERLKEAVVRAAGLSN